MFSFIKVFLSCINNFFVFFKKKTRPDPKWSFKNLGFFKIKFLSNKLLKYKFYLYLYILVTLSLCPYLDYHFITWYDNETYNMYIMLAVAFLINCLLNFFLKIPTKINFSFKLLVLKLKSLYFYINFFLVRILKFWLFFKDEILAKSFFFNFLKKCFKNFSNYFI